MFVASVTSGAKNWFLNLEWLGVVQRVMGRVKLQIYLLNKYGTLRIRKNKVIVARKICKLKEKMDGPYRSKTI